MENLHIGIWAVIVDVWNAFSPWVPSGGWLKLAAVLNAISVALGIYCIGWKVGYKTIWDNLVTEKAEKGQVIWSRDDITRGIVYTFATAVLWTSWFAAFAAWLANWIRN